MKKLIVLFALIGLMGCSVLSNIETRQEATAMVYRLTTWRLINEDINRAWQIDTYTSRMIEDIEAGRLITLEALKSEMRHVVAKVGLTPMEVLTLEELVGLFTRDLMNAQIDEIQKIHAIILPRLKWINDAAVRMADFLEAS